MGHFKGWVDNTNHPDQEKKEDPELYPIQNHPDGYFIHELMIKRLIAPTVLSDGKYRKFLQ
jgi:hypothetical protein